MPARKLFIDSRAAREGEASDFVWQPGRPLHIDKSRAFIDSVHMPVNWPTIHSQNQYLYITEPMSFFTVLTTANRLYITEGAAYRIITIPALVAGSASQYDGPGLATALATAFGAAYTVAYVNSGGLGSLTITSSGDFKIASRQELQALTSWGASAINPGNLQDASDLFGTLTQSAQGPATVTLSPALFYRRVAIPEGHYVFTDFAAVLQLALNTGSYWATLPAGPGYVVESVPITGKLKVTNSNGAFNIWPEQYLEANPYSYMGYAAPFHANENIGYVGTSVLGGDAPEFFNVSAYHTLFITCSLGTHGDTVGPLGQSSIARKVVLDQPYGTFVHDFHSMPLDFLALEGQSITAIRLA